MHSAKIKTGDKVIMLSGKDRSKSGKIVRVSTAESRTGLMQTRVFVEGLNMIKRHERAKKQGQKGQIVSRERAVALSSVALICSKCDKPTRVGFRLDAGNKYRQCRKCHADI